MPDAAGVGAVAGADAAEASVIGPGLSPLSAFISTCPLPDASDARSDSAQLCALVCAMGCALWLLEPPSIGDIDRAIGNAVICRKFVVIGCGGYTTATGTDASVAPTSWFMPLVSSTTSLPARMPQSARN